MRSRLLLSAAFLAFTGTAAHADVQSLDYGSLQSIFGEPVTTSATGTPLRASETPVDMTIVTAEDIRRAGTRSIPEILARIPGLDILQTGINVYDVGVRGYQQPFQPRLLVLVDGRQVFIDDYSRTLWDNIPVNVDDIRQIEVVKGAASAMFGSNAAGGVINIVTYSPVYDTNRVVTMAGGTQSNLSGDATMTVNGEWGGMKLTAGGLNEREFATDRYTNPDAGYPCCDQSPAFRPYHYYVTDSATFNASPSLQLMSEFTLSKSKGNTGDPTDDFIVGGQVATTFSGRIGAAWKSPFGLITSDTYYNRSLVSLYEPTDGGTPYQFTTNLLVSQLTDQFKAGVSDTFRAELEYRYKTFDFRNVQVTPASPELTENNVAAAGTWLHQFSGSLSSTVAFRFDHLAMQETGDLGTGFPFTAADYSHDINAWSGNADLVWVIGAADSLKGGYGRGIQMPSFMQSQYGQTVIYIGTPSIYPGNPRLKPTIVQDLTLEYSHALESLSSVVTLSPYYEMNQDIVAPFQVAGTEQLLGQTFTISTSSNVGNSKGWGGELQLKGEGGGLRWDVSYSLSRVSDSGGLNPANVISYAHSTPSHHLRAWLGYSAGAWEIDGNAQYLSGSTMLRGIDGGFSDQLIDSRAYSSIGARVAYAATDHVTLAMNGVNIQSHTQTTSPYPVLERQILFSVTGRF